MSPNPSSHTSSPARRLVMIRLPLLVTLAAAPVFAQEPSVISGTVVAEVSQRPLAGAQVVVTDQAGSAAVTDASGRFRITGVSGTEVTLTVRLIGYRSV